MNIGVPKERRPFEYRVGLTPASNERVSEMLRNLQANSKFLERRELVEIKVSGQQPPGVQRRLFDFSLNFSLQPTPERAQLQQAQTEKPAQAAKK